MKVCIHTKMVNTSGVAVLPKKALLFLSRRHLFRFGKLNASTVQISENEIDFFYDEKFPTMTNEGLYLYNNGKYLWGGCFTQGSFPFLPRCHLFRYGKLKTILSPSQDPKKLNDFDFINQCLTISNVCYGLKKTG